MIVEEIANWEVQVSGTGLGAGQQLLSENSFYLPAVRAQELKHRSVLGGERDDPNGMLFNVVNSTQWHQIENHIIPAAANGFDVRGVNPAAPADQTVAWLQGVLDGLILNSAGLGEEHRSFLTHSLPTCKSCQSDAVVFETGSQAKAKKTAAAIQIIGVLRSLGAVFSRCT